MTTQEKLKTIYLQKDWVIEELMSFLYQKDISKDYLETLAGALSEQAQNLMVLADEIEKILDDLQG